MTDRATWERAAEKALLECNGYAQLQGDMRARLDAVVPWTERCCYTNDNERCLMFLFMACVEDDET